MPLQKISVQTLGSTKKRISDKDVFHAYMTKGARFTGPYDFPVLEPTFIRAKNLISFPEAIVEKCIDFHKIVHFFVDDFRFERFWNQPYKYLDKLKKYDAVIAPDFSTCPNFPMALKIYNTYRNVVSAYWIQQNGICVIPNVRCEEETVNWALDGIPTGGTIAVGSNGCIKNHSNRTRFKKSLKIAVDKVKPRNIIVYGSDAYGVFDYPRNCGIEIDLCPSSTFKHSGSDYHELKVY